MLNNVNAVNLTKISVVHSITPTERFFKKKDRQGNVINKYPNCYAVRCSYEGNHNYLFIATDKEVEQLRPVSKSEFNELVREVRNLQTSKGK